MNEKRKVAMRVLGATRKHIKHERELLKRKGYSEKQIKRLLDPMICFQRQLEEELEHDESGACDVP